MNLSPREITVTSIKGLVIKVQYLFFTATVFCLSHVCLDVFDFKPFSLARVSSLNLRTYRFLPLKASSENWSHKEEEEPAVAVTKIV